MNGKELKAERQKRGYSQQVVADAINVSQKTIYNFEAERTTPSIFQIEQLKMFFKIETVQKTKETIIMGLLRRLIDEGIITDENNIEKNTLDLLIGAIKQDIKIIKKGSI